MAKSREEQSMASTSKGSFSKKKSPMKFGTTSGMSKHTSPTRAKHDIETLSRGHDDSQDEDLKTAIELSRQCTYDLELGQSKSVKNVDVPCPFITMATKKSDSQDEEFQKALELSKQSITSNVSADTTDRQDEELQKILELSRLEQSINGHVTEDPNHNIISLLGNKQTVVTSDSQDEELQRILELSRLEQSMDRHITEDSNHKMISVMSHEQTVVSSDSQDQELQTSLKLSLLEQSQGSHLIKKEKLEDKCQNYQYKTNNGGCNMVDADLTPGETINRQELLLLDGEEEIRLALTQSLPEVKTSTVCTVDILSEEEQLKRAIEQSKQELLQSVKCDHENQSKQELLQSVKFDHENQSKQELLQSVKFDHDHKANDDSEESVILIDSQEIEGENNCVIIDEITGPRQTSCKLNKRHQLSDDNVDSSAVNALVEIQNQNFMENQFLNRNSCKKAERNTRRTKIDTTKVEVFVCEENQSENDCSLLGNQDLVNMENISESTTSKVLVEDSQVDSDHQELDSVCVSVPESLEYNLNEDIYNDIDVIPPSPGKQSPLTTRNISREITPKQILTLNANQREATPKQKLKEKENSEIVDNKLLKGDNFEETCTQESQSVSLLLGFIDSNQTEQSSNKTCCKNSQNYESSSKSNSMSDKIVMTFKNKNQENSQQINNSCYSDNFLKVKVDPCDTSVKEEAPCDFINLKVKDEVEKNDSNTIESQAVFVPENIDKYDKAVVPSIILSTRENVTKNYSIDILVHCSTSNENSLTGTRLECETMGEEYTRNIQDEIKGELDQTKCLTHILKTSDVKTDNISYIDQHQKFDGESESDICIDDCANDEELARRLQEKFYKVDNVLSPDHTEKRKLRKRRHDSKNSAYDSENEPEVFVSLQEVLSQHDVEENIRKKLKMEKDDLELAQIMQKNGEDLDPDCMKDGCNRREEMIEKQDCEVTERMREEYTEEIPEQKLLREKQDYELAKSILENNSIVNDNRDEQDNNMLQQRLLQEKQDEELARRLEEAEKTKHNGLLYM